MNVFLLVPILLPLLAGGLLPLLVSADNRRKREIYVASVVIANSLFVLLSTSLGDLELRALNLGSAISFYIKMDDLARVFLVLASFIWILVTFYSFEYIKSVGKETRFFSFFLMTYGVIMGACLSGNFFTLYLFYEAMTLLTYPLVAHSGTSAAIRAGNKYLLYSFVGAGLTLVCFAFIANFGITTDFIPGGVLDLAAVSGNEGQLLVVFLLAFMGFGCKAYIWPLFEWAPLSYPESPAPAAALFSGIVSKVAVLAIIRVAFYIFGVDFLSGSWVQTVLICVSLLTVFVGSMLAYKEKLFTRRLAYSSVSQLSYILFGIVLFNSVAFLGAMLHVLFHAIIKVTLFLSAGAVIYKTQKTYVYELRGIGKSMPITMWCFTIAAVSLVGVPPTVGFISKWFLAMGGIGSSYPILGLVGAGVLLISALLTGGYLITIFAAAFFPGSGFDYQKLEKAEANKLMAVPLITLASLCLLLGMFPGAIMGFIDRISVLLF